ncbi:MAG: hypothetical protein WCG03_10170, partial [Kiritimatiellales bacterium]
MKKIISMMVVITALSLSSSAALPTAAYSYQFGMLETFESMGKSEDAPKLGKKHLWSVTADRVESASKLETAAPSTSGNSSSEKITGYNAGSGTNRTLALFVKGTATTNSYFITKFVNATSNTLTSIELYYDLEVCWIHLTQGTTQSGNLTASISTNGTTWVTNGLTLLAGSISSSNATIDHTWLTDAQMDQQKLSQRNIGGIIPLPAALPSIQAGQEFYIRWTVDSGSKDMIYGIDDLRAGPKDSDRDGMPDVWEVANSLNPTNSLDALLDADSDGLTNLQEYQRGTNPKLADSDADGLSDGNEVTRGTNPLKTDTDNDGMPDGWEVTNGFNPLVNDASTDADSDGLTNLQEYQRGTNPKLADSDADGMPDGWEVTN